MEVEGHSNRESERYTQGPWETTGPSSKATRRTRPRVHERSLKNEFSLPLVHFTAAQSTYMHMYMHCGAHRIGQDSEPQDSREAQSAKDFEC
jgi:hypothetical protein